MKPAEERPNYWALLAHKADGIEEDTMPDQDQHTVEKAMTTIATTAINN